MRLGRSLLYSGPRERGHHLLHKVIGEDTRVGRKQKTGAQRFKIMVFVGLPWERQDWEK